MKKIIISFICAIAFVMTFLQPAPTPSVYAAAIADYQATPPFLTTSTPPLVMLTMGRDHKLYYEAYPDTSDLNGDGVLDIRYNPSIDYYGYFDPYKVYTYSSGRFEPYSVTTDKTNGGVSGGWSGNFLNYLTMSRMDALRKVLYGGYRSTDDATTGASSVVLQRVYIPQDAHSWGKEYDPAVDTYAITDYTPLSQPAADKRHLFASTTLSDNGTPILRVANDNSHRIWDWVSKERPVCDASIVTIDRYDTYPYNHTEYDALVAEFATPAHLQGTQSATQINGSGNPFGDDDYYLTIFAGTINVTTGGTYQFAVDGDDAVEVMIDNVVRASWYGGHGSCGCTDHKGGTFTLTAGAHTVVFRHQERTGDDSYYLRWRGPDSTYNWQIVPAAKFSGLTQTVYNVLRGGVGTITDYAVKVVVCDPTVGLESNCKEYSVDGTNKTYKPVGLLQKYGEGDKMYFGLITGSYTKNDSGGVLRKKMGSITDEINPDTGQFTSTNGIIQTINKLRTVGFNYSSYSYEGTSGGIDCNCGWIADRTINEGECRMWGNPIAEMMYEGVRYFAGKASPTSAFTYSEGTNDDSSYLQLPQVTDWNDPYDPADNGYSYCAKPVMLVISDINPSYDTDQLPGSAFGSLSGDLSGLNVADLADTITNNEADTTGSHYIGQSGGVYNGACTPKTVSSLGNTRGLCPEEPTKRGGYYSGSVAYYAKKTDLNPAEGDQKMDTFAVALASPLPRIEIPMGSGRMITLVPFAKSVGGYGISPDHGAFQPTNTIVDFYVEELTDTYGKFRINFEDVEQGADHDMDAIVIYEYTVSGDNVTITLTSEYAAGSIIQHLGYIISGTTADGTYLEVRDVDTAEGSDPDYYLDTPPGPPQIWPSASYDPDGPWDDDTYLPFVATRTFTAGATAGATLLTNPLWYAAKWGGFKDYNDNDLPDQQNEWDEDDDGTPDTYFYVTNPLKLEEQLENAFTKIIKRVASATAVSVLSTSEQGEGSLYQAYFNPSVTEGAREVTWTGYLQNLWVDRKGNLREDTVSDEALVSTEDAIIKFVRNTSTGEVEIYKYHDSTGDCVPDDSDGNPDNGATPYTIVSLSDIKPVWEAGKRLAEFSAGDRTIKTFVDADKDGIIDSGEFIDFQTTNKTALRPYLRAADDTESNNLIEYIRGVQLSAAIGYRDRQLTVNSTLRVWKLGDIVYSTPSVVGKPLSNYNVIYNDATYDAYYRKYKDRDTVVYVGANDGMLHAFWGGKSVSGDNPATTSTTEASWYSKASGLGTNLGEELWAYIPYNLLPHLKWLADPNYPHVYYVDLKPRYADVKIFTPDTNHPNGWGTILIGGMRLGGKPIAVTDDFGSGSETRTFRSAYFAIDITVPDAPTVLWEYTDTTGKLGLTTCYPTIIKVQDKWFAFFGSGPTDLTKGDCSDTNKKGDLFVLDLATGAPLKIFETAELGAFFSDPITVDTQVDYSVDTIYIPETYQSGGAYQGKIYRLWTKDSSNAINDDPTQWVAPSALFNAKSGQPITSGLVLSYDNLHNLWAFFGTGKYMGVIDKTDSEQQAFYGIKEPCLTATCADTVVNDDVSLFNSTDAHIFQDSGSVRVEGVSGATTWQELLNKATTYPGGWYFNLWKSGTDPSERVINRPTVLGGIALFTTFIPDTDVCSYGGSSNLYALNYITGTANNTQVIGTSDSGEILNKEELGVGMASGIAIHTGGDDAGANKYIQMSTGQIIGQKVYPPGDIKSGIASWRETK